MINFVYQLDWAIGCPDIWLDSILGVSVRMFLDNIKLWINRVTKADHPSQCKQLSSTPLKARIGQMLSKKEFTIFSWWFLLWDTGLLLPSGSDWNVHFWLSCYQAFGLQVFGLLSPHNFMSQLFISYLSVCLPINLSCAPAQSLSHAQLFVIPWTVACQFSLCIEFSRQEYWSGCHFLHQGIFLTQGLNPNLQHWQADSLPLSHQESPSVICPSICLSSYWFQVSGELWYSWGIQ